MPSLLRSLSSQVDVDAHLTGSELLRRIQLYAAGFRREGIQKGTRVCCQTGNALENMVAAMGIVFAGGTLVMAKTAFVESKPSILFAQILVCVMVI